ncbi:FHA domain-containing protein [Candidatus Poribacteria bacterium]|nr:FHA domain-containing protein [Candidatus Poribacteria bacterium]
MMKRIGVIPLFLLWVGLAWAAPRLYVNDVLSNPARYYNTVVEIEGDVTNVTPGTTTLTSGLYKLTDDLDGQIEVRTRELPAIGKRFVVKGMVSQEAATSIPYLRELSRKAPGFPVVGLVVAAVVFLLLVVVLLVLVFRPQRVAEAPQPVVPATNTPARQGTSENATSQPTGWIPTTRHEESRYQPTVAYLEGVQASLTLIEGPADVNKVYPITKRESIIGRDGDIKLSKAHLTVSNEHARLTYLGSGQFTLTHLSRTNTTQVNGQHVTENRPLESGDEIQLGATTLRFEIQS